MTGSNKSVSPLRRRTIDDITLRNLSQDPDCVYADGQDLRAVLWARARSSLRKASTVPSQTRHRTQPQEKTRTIKTSSRGQPRITSTISLQPRHDDPGPGLTSVPREIPDPFQPELLRSALGAVGRCAGVHAIQNPAARRSFVGLVAGISLLNALPSSCKSQTGEAYANKH